MYTIVYTSRESWRLTRNELFLLLIESRDNNAKFSITGLLLHGHGRFIQVIEGKQEDIERLYSNIQKDHRNMQVKTLLSKPVPQRNFADWHMGFVSAYEDEKDNIAGMSRFLDADYDIEPCAAASNEVFDYLLEFRSKIEKSRFVDI